MGDELYLVNTSIKPIFLDWEIARTSPTNAKEAHEKFVYEVRKNYAGFDAPYFALLSDETLRIPISINPLLGVSSFVMRKGMVIGEGEEGGDCTLDAFIDRNILFCKQHSGFEDKLFPLVEFSPTELYPKEIERLARKYDIKRIVVD